MQLKDLNIGDKFYINKDDSYPELFEYKSNYLVISTNSDNFTIHHQDEFRNMDKYCFVLNIDTSTLGILLKTQEVHLYD